MQKNYYLILGVASDADLDEIKAAFRRRAMELHPDHSGLESGPFLEAKEAYGVLSDPALWRNYDRQSSAFVRRRPSRSWSEPLVHKRIRLEPFAARGFRETSVAESFFSHAPSFEEIFERLGGNFDSVSPPKVEHLGCLTVQVILSPAEASDGGSVRVDIPARATCPACAGDGWVDFFECWRCQGHGALGAKYPVEVAYPPGLPDGYVLRLPLSRFHTDKFYLTMLFRVSREI